MRVLAVALVLAATACGGAHRSGAKVFARDCAGCHSLTGQERGAMGGDLGIAKLGIADLESFSRTMPTPDRLSASEVHAVAVYVREHETHALRVR